jgi:molecular chaperone HscC
MAKIGIDLGTSNSLAAYWTEEGPALIPNAFGQFLTPSIVSVDENNEILVGQIAKERLITHPSLTVSTFKRYMGTDKMYQLGNLTLSPEDLSSFILRSLKSDAESFLGEVIDEAVISVPAYFNDAQRKATKRAANLAGLHVERLISEPTAAAVSYGLHLQDADTKFLVFDLGGGTFDVSVLDYFEGVMQVQAIAGDNYLGGEDFTNVVMSHFVEFHKLNFNEMPHKTQSALQKQAELCKLSLSQNVTGQMELNYEDQSYTLSVTKEQFDQICSSLLLRLRNPVERALRDASLMPSDIDGIILIGGATRMSVIKTIVSKIFGRLPNFDINPDEAVALGAAIQVALKERNVSLKEMILTDVCPYTLGTDVIRRSNNGSVDSGYFLPIIERNTPIPVSRVERLYTAHDQQSIISVEVYQGESRLVKNNVKIGELEVAVPKAERGEQSIDVRYTYDINGVLEVEVTVVKTQERKTIVIEQNPGQSTPEAIQARLQELAHLKIHPRDRSENRLLLARCERLYEEYIGQEREYISQLTYEFERVLATQDDTLIRSEAAVLKQNLDNMERWKI